MAKIESISWGNETLDAISDGIPANDFAVLESKDHRSSIILLGQILMDGLKNGKSSVLITHQPFHLFNQQLLHFGFDLTPFVKSNQLVHLTYKSEIKLIMGTTQNYDEALKEIFDFHSDHVPDRIFFHQVDALLNLTNTLVMNISVSKFATAARSVLSKETSVICSFTAYDDETHKTLSHALQKTASGYYKSDLADEGHETVLFKVIKQPWYGFSSKEELVNLNLAKYGLAKLKKHA